MNAGCEGCWPLRPGGLLGLPEGAPNAVLDVGAFRYLLLALAVLWAVRALRGGWSALAAGLLFTVAAIGFWVLALARPYGLLVDDEITRQAALISVASALRRTASFLAGEPDAGFARSWLAAKGAHPAGLILLPTFLPLMVVPLLALEIRGLWTARGDAGLAALLWLAGSTGYLDTLRGVGLVPAMWGHPEAAVALVVLVPIVLGLGRALARWPRLWPLVALACLAWLAVPASPRPPAAELPLLLTLDQEAWFFLGYWGLVRHRDPTASALVCGGGALTLLSAFHPLDVWGAHALYRMGLILASARPARAIAGLAADALARRYPRLGGSGDLGAALLVLLLVPGSALAWWDPSRQDEIARASVEPLSASVDGAMAWVRNHTSPEAVFIASPDYAPSVAVLGARRILRAPALAKTADDERRARLERLTLSGVPPAALLRLYGVTHVLVAPGDFRSYGLRAPEDLGRREGFRLLYEDREGRRIYAVNVQ
jgi:hypothetical protein